MQSTMSRRKDGSWESQERGCGRVSVGASGARAGWGQMERSSKLVLQGCSWCDAIVGQLGDLERAGAGGQEAGDTFDFARATSLIYRG